MQTACKNHCTSIWEYVLMTNHVHYIMVPERVDSLAKTIREAHGKYSRYLNTKYGLVGHAWQGRFKSLAMDWEHYVNAVRYVLQNPVRAGLVAKAEEYLWSSAAARCGLRADLLISSHPFVDEMANWSEWLRIEDLKANDLIRRNTRTGRPIGSKEFIKRLEGQTGRRLSAQKRGRPKLRDQSSASGLELKIPPEIRSLFGDGDV